jgi:NitT/TauT family transport system substrate-binding protein
MNVGVKLSSLMLSLAIFLSGCGSSQETGQSTTPPAPSEISNTNAPKPVNPPVSIKIGYPTQGASMLPLWVAKDAGLLKKYGINAEIIYIAGTPRVQETLTSDGIQVGLVGVDAVGKSKVAGHDSLILSSVADRPAVYVYGQKDLNASDLKADLKGKTLITAAEGSLYDHLGRSFLNEQGLKPIEDVKMLFMGGEGDRTAAFIKGEGAAYVVAPPTSFKIEEMGYKKIYDFSKTELLLAGIGMTREYYEKNPEVAKGVVAALIEANSLILHDKEKAIQSIMKWTSNDDRSLAEKTYEVHLPTIPKKPYVTDQAVQFFLKNSNIEAVRSLKPSDLVDNHIVKELDESGWIDSLYK